MVKIGFFGLRNVGKSSLVNRITNQDMSVVSSVKGTTTDSVKKTMELLPIGPVTIIDTPGYDDEGDLGEKRITATKKVLRNCDVAILVTEAGREFVSKEEELINIFQERKIPYLIVKNKSDLLEEPFQETENILYVSSISGIGIEELKEKIGKTFAKKDKEIHFVSDFIQEKEIVVLVVPIDKSAPKGRIILPQQLAIREILDKHAIPLEVQVDELSQVLELLKEKIKLVITDSQVFEIVKNIVPEDVELTSFSILMARYKGFLDAAIKGAKAIDLLDKGANVLIAEGCTHHKQCEDIGTVKLPKWIKNYTQKEFHFTWTNGMGFPDNVEKYDLIIHCGGCMLNENEMQYRLNEATKRNIPFTNYGIMISYMQGIIERSTRIIYNKN